MKKENYKDKIEEIKCLFELAESEFDFCIDCQDDKIVIGSWNRVYIYRNNPTKVSSYHCKKEFIEIAKTLGFKIN